MFGTLVSDMQSGVRVSRDNVITGRIKYLTEGSLVDRWGAGNFIALRFDDIYEGATSVKVGMDPSQGSGLVEIIDDPDKNGAWKITDKDIQKFKCVTSDGTNSLTQTFDLSNLVLDPAPAVEEPEATDNSEEE